MKRQVFRITCIVGLVILMAGCAALKGKTPQQTALANGYKTLASARIVYNSTMTALGDLRAQGLVNDTQKAQIITAGQQFCKWEAVAAQSLDTYALTMDSVTQQQATKDLASFTVWYSNFINIVKPLMTLIDPSWNVTVPATPTL